jgi:hypothetical protein
MTIALQILLLFCLLALIVLGYSNFPTKKSTILLKLTDNVESVHLQLNNNNNNNNDKNISTEIEGNSPFTVLLTEYVNIENNKTILASAEGLSTDELSIYSRYLFNQNYSLQTGVITRKRRVNLKCHDTYNELMSLWKSEKLLVKSKDFPSNILINEDKVDKFKSIISSHIRKMKMVHEDSKLYDNIIQKFLNVSINFTEYSNINIIALNFDEKISKLKSFAVWFRDEFPYYYDNCIFCKNKQSNFQYGSVYPTKEELSYHARITELYCCSICKETSRFPRFNSVHKVLDTRRGRCGEYSMLMLRMLNLLGRTHTFNSFLATYTYLLN